MEALIELGSGVERDITEIILFAVGKPAFDNVADLVLFVIKLNRVAAQVFLGERNVAVGSTHVFDSQFHFIDFV